MARVIFVAIIGTTHTFDYGGQLTKIAKPALEDAAVQIRSGKVPMRLSHDTTCPPLAAWQDAWVEELPDGDFALKGAGEIRDDEEFLSLDEYSIREHVSGQTPVTFSGISFLPDALSAELGYDARLFDPGEVKSFTDKLAPAVRITPKEELRLSSLPTPELLIVLAIPLYWFSKGFFTKFGEGLGDAASEEVCWAYRTLKDAIVRLIRERRNSDTPTVIVKTEPLQVIGGQIHWAIKSDREQVISEALDALQAAQSELERLLKDSRLGIATTSMLYDEQQQCWAINYLELDSGEIILSPTGRGNVQRILDKFGDGLGKGR